MARRQEPGWYPDPALPGRWRWWDGRAWTDHVVAAERGPRGAAPRAVAGEARPETGEGAAHPEEAHPTPPGGQPALGPQGRAGQVRAARRARLPGSRAVFARRWAAVVGAVLVLVLVMLVATRGGGPTLYWQGRPISGAGQVLAEGAKDLQAMAADNEGVLAGSSRCYFSLPARGSHDVAPYLRCGPLLLPWSSPGRSWATLPLQARPGPGRDVGVVLRRAALPTTTVALSPGEVLARPDGAGVPKGDGGLSVPLVPRQPAWWTGVLRQPPDGLRPAPPGALLGAWGQSYRLVASGQVDRLPADLVPGALRAASVPAGSAFSVPGRGPAGRPPAHLLLPPSGQVFVVAQLAVGPGESSGAVGRAGTGGAPADRPVLAVQSGGHRAPVRAPAGPTAPGASPVTMSFVAAVPVGSRPLLSVTDKGLTESVSLVDGQLYGVPGALTRTGTDDPLNASGRLGGTTVHLRDASLVWFAGGDGGTTPPTYDQAYLQVLATTTPAAASLGLSASSFSLRLPSGQSLAAQSLPVYNRTDVVVGFVVPASFSTGTVVVGRPGHGFEVPVHFD